MSGVRERRLKRLVDRARPAQVGGALLFALASAAAMTATLVWPGAPAQAQCATAGVNQTCTNSVFLSGGGVGIFDGATLTVTNTNTGTITGTNAGIAATTANVTNAGIITSTGLASVAVFATDAVNLTNSGNIAGTGINSTGVQALNTASITNSGSISGPLPASLRFPPPAASPSSIPVAFRGAGSASQPSPPPPSSIRGSSPERPE